MVTDFFSLTIKNTPFFLEIRFRDHVQDGVVVIAEISHVVFSSVSSFCFGFGVSSVFRIYSLAIPYADYSDGPEQRLASVWLFACSYFHVDSKFTELLT
ncbi:hypothetical protein KL939_000743 [Ogataea angusta]|nr:hypothetical protein KL939_000743 [Ogataea angusta]